MSDEFEIKATGHVTESDRTWTRSKIGSAMVIAEQAVEKLSYARAVVVNTFGGVRSNPIYIVTTGCEMKPES